MGAASPRPWRLAAGLLLLGGALAVGLLTGPVTGCSDAEAGVEAQRVIVLGFDGLDFELTRKLIDDGRLPNFARLEQMGGFSPLATAVPPQSPVAWSNFITGMDSGGHGIFDFVHRDPDTMLPYLSTSRTAGAERSLTVGSWSIPLAGARIELLRHGTAFWEVLDDAGVDTTIVRMPANFPPSGSAKRELSGMGTPDVLGTYGTFSYYTSDPFFDVSREISGGRAYGFPTYGDTVRGTLYGPENPFLAEPEPVSRDFTVHIDPDEDVAKFVIGDEEDVVRAGEWSRWMRVSFDLAPTQSLDAIVRFYLRRVRPEIEMYATPLNIDPHRPAMPISTPEGWAGELSDATGAFFTQGMPEETKALSAGIFDQEEFLQQARITAEENLKQYRWILDRFEEGLLFYYFGHVDQVCHMLWRSMDPDHPAYDAERDAPLAGAIPELYEELDDVVGETLERMPPDTLLVVMSDHGFASWRRAFHLNTWLQQEGYLALDPKRGHAEDILSGADWGRTRAYGLGLNGLYLNIRGRESTGIVLPSERDALLDELEEKLLAVVDPATGEPAITKVYRRERVYDDRGWLEIGPDLQVGYAKGTRCSNESAIGELGARSFTDNHEAWSGDHCMDHEAVPGILLTNRPLTQRATSLENLAAAILAEYGIEGFPQRD